MLPTILKTLLLNWSLSTIWPQRVTFVCREISSDNCFSPDVLTAMLCPVAPTFVSFRVKHDIKHHLSSPYHLQHGLSLKI